MRSSRISKSLISKSYCSRIGDLLSTDWIRSGMTFWLFSIAYRDNSSCFSICLFLIFVAYDLSMWPSLTACFSCSTSSLSLSNILTTCTCLGSSSTLFSFFISIWGPHSFWTRGPTYNIPGPTVLYLLKIWLEVSPELVTPVFLLWRGEFSAVI